MHLSLPLFSLTQWKDKCASYSFTTKKLTHSICQVSLAVKHKWTLALWQNKMVHPIWSACTPAHSCQTIRCMQGHLLSSQHIAKALQCRAQFFWLTLVCTNVCSKSPYFGHFKAPVWPWKLGQGHQNIINSSPPPNNVSMLDWLKSTIRFRRYRTETKFWTFQSVCVTLKNRSRSPKTYQLFASSQQCIYASLVKIHPLV